MWVEPVILEGNFVRLEPMTEEHAYRLSLVGNDPSIWRYMLYGELTTEQSMLEWVRDILSRSAAGTDQPFVVIHKESGIVAGATRYMEIRPQHRGLEIGGTWYGVQFQRTSVNTEAKYLLLRHAFEDLKAIRVQFKTDSRNERSQRAIERLGAVREGLLRNHMVLEDGVIRHSIYYSILDSEWPAVKVQLETRLEQN